MGENRGRKGILLGDKSHLPGANLGVKEHVGKGSLNLLLVLLVVEVGLDLAKLVELGLGKRDLGALHGKTEQIGTHDRQESLHVSQSTTPPREQGRRGCGRADQLALSGSWLPGGPRPPCGPG